MPSARPFDPQLLESASAQVLRPLLALFDHLPNVYLYAKDTAHRFLHLNEALVRLLGHQQLETLLGLTDMDVQKLPLATLYIEEDRRVFTTGRPVLREPWLVTGADGMPRWYLSTKLPFLDQRGRVLGLVGVMHPFDEGTDAPGDYQRLSPAIQHVLAHYGGRVELPDLAHCCHLSVSQFRRLFQKLFQTTPGDYLLRVRLLMARRRLEATAQPVGQIALDCGFYDQSHFTRAFRQNTGLTPLAYRSKHGPKARPS